MPVFYLKYRPQKISDLDLEEVRNGLSRVLASERIPHAFLFAGPRGTGKTSAARIIAKAVNCETRKTFEPCNKCSMCKSITRGVALDLIEIDAASNRGIDDVRELREKIKLAPVAGKYKIYIIDESHMLTAEAFNALLKTLEEPPAHAIFILCTTEPARLPETIISRCLRFNFRRGRVEEVVRCLQKVVKGEKLKVEKEALKEIARHVDGSFRDAQKILEQLSLRRGEITIEMVREELGKSRQYRPELLLALLAEKNTRAALLEINRAVEGGVNLHVYVEELLELLRDSLLFEIGLSDKELGNQKARNLAKTLKKEQIVRLIELFTRAGRGLKTAIIPQLPLELAAVEWCGLTSEKSPRATSEVSK